MEKNSPNVFAVLNMKATAEKKKLPFNGFGGFLLFSFVLGFWSKSHPFFI